MDVKGNNKKSIPRTLYCMKKHTFQQDIKTKYNKKESISIPLRK